MKFPLGWQIGAWLGELKRRQSSWKQLEMNHMTYLAKLERSAAPACLRIWSLRELLNYPTNLYSQGCQTIPPWLVFSHLHRFHIIFSPISLLYQIEAWLTLGCLLLKNKCQCLKFSFNFLNTRSVFELWSMASSFQYWWRNYTISY